MLTNINNDTIMIAIIAFIIGAIIFFLIGRASSKVSTENHPLKKQYDELKKEFEQYKANVNTHFAKTADAVDNLTKSYKEVFTHLSEGAENLMDKAALKIEREKRQGKSVTLAYLAEEKKETDKPVATPRPAEAAKPATAPKNENASLTNNNKPETPSKNTSSTEAAKPATTAKASTPKSTLPTEKTATTKATEKANPTATAEPEQGIEAVKRHIRENQPKQK